MPTTILIVEDHDVMRKTLRDWLAVEFPDCRLIEVVSGEKALVLTQREAPRLVLMDIGLPGMSGIEATRQIKAISPDTHVVILTIHEGAAYRKDAMAAGASAYVTKKAMQQELIATMTELLEKNV